MNISFDNSAKVSGRLTLVVEEADYKKDYDKTIKEQCRRASIPGFRPGKAPRAMVERQIGPSVLVDTLNKLVGGKVSEYIQTENLYVLGEPMPAKDQEQIDLGKPAPYTFMFDLALAPEIDVTLGADDTVPYYTIDVDDKLVDQQVQMYTSRAGSYEKVETYEDNDMLKGDLRQLDADGNTLEGGIAVSEATVMPKYIKNAEEAAKFAGIKLGDIITFNPRKAYESDTELAAFLKIDKEQAFIYTGDFSYQVTEISRFKPHAVDAELFAQAFPGEDIADEAAFRTRVAGEIKNQLAGSSEFRFMADVRNVAVAKAGEIKFDDDLMKQIMLANNKDKGMEFVEKNYPKSIQELTWSLIKNKLAEDNNVKIEEADVKEAAREAARMQFAQYGMPNVPDEYLENYVQEMMKKQENVNGLVERAIDVKLGAALKQVVRLDEKTISLDEFNKLGE